MSEEPITLNPRPRAGLTFSHIRADLARDTGIMVQRNVRGHIHIQLGEASEITLIIHPHAAQRLVASINDVLAGSDFEYK